MKKDLVFPAANRLRYSVEFNRVWQQGKRYHTAHFIVITRSNGTDRLRLGLTVSRKVGNAVCRNQLKRWLREYFRTELSPRIAGLDISIVAKRLAGQLEHEQLVQELHNLFARLETGRHV